MFENHKLVPNEKRFIQRKTIDHYPLAFLDNIGSLQARQPFPPFHKASKDVNRKIARQMSGDDNVTTVQEADPNFAPEYPVQSLAAVVPTSVQMYSLISHLLSPNANENRSKHSEVTAAIAGAFAVTQAEKDKAKLARDRLQTGLTAETFFRLIEQTPTAPPLRIEQVFYYDMDSLKPEYHNGLYIYECSTDNILRTESMCII